MGTSKRDKCVLKLVHPGRHVEIHKKPITAAEVMKKNPRHSIVRPNFFKVPWINVVRPGSVLVPGEVFYIVPDRTTYDLLKAKCCNPARQKQNHFEENNDNHRAKSCAGITPKHQNHVQGLKKLSAECVVTIFQEEDSDKGLTTPSQARSWPEVIKKRSALPEKVDKLRPCLRKQDSIRKSLNLKVSFALSSTTQTTQLESPEFQQNGCACYSQ